MYYVEPFELTEPTVDFLLSLFLQLFDKAELLECIKKLIEVDQDWVPYSQDASLYIRPTFIGIEVSFSVLNQLLLHRVGMQSCIFLLVLNRLTSCF